MSNATDADLWRNSVTLTVEETARMLKVHPDTVRARIKDGTLPTVNFGRRVLIPTDSVRALVGSAE